MRILERLFCNYVWLLWIGMSVGEHNTRSEERPVPLASRDLVPNRTVLPGWYGSL